MKGKEYGKIYMQLTSVSPENQNDKRGSTCKSLKGEMSCWKSFNV